MDNQTHSGLYHAAVAVFSALIVGGTYVHWFYRTWYGQPVNPLVTLFALFITVAAMRSLFGGGVVTRSLEMLADVKHLAEVADRTPAVEQVDDDDLTEGYQSTSEVREAAREAGEVAGRELARELTERDADPEGPNE